MDLQGEDLVGLDTTAGERGVTLAGCGAAVRHHPERLSLGYTATPITLGAILDAKHGVAVLVRQGSTAERGEPGIAISQESGQGVGGPVVRIAAKLGHAGESRRCKGKGDSQ